MIKRVQFYFLLFTASALVVSCVSTDIDRSADFSSLRTFGWGDTEVDSENPVYSGELVDKNIRFAIREQFDRKNISFNPENPDFLVHYYTHTEKKEQSRITRTYPYSPFYGFYRPYFFYPYAAWMYGFPYMGIPQREKMEYTEGTLIVDIEDTASGEVIWRGSVSAKLDGLKGLKKQIEKGVRAIIKKYPGTPTAPDDGGKVLPDKDVIG